jgi:hypothetical protein
MFETPDCGICPLRQAPSRNPSGFRHKRRFADRIKPGEQVAQDQSRETPGREHNLTQTAPPIDDLCAHVESVWVKAIAAGDPAAAEGIKKYVASMKTSLAGQNPGALEKVLVSNIVASHLALSHAMLAAAEPNLGDSRAILRDRRVESAQRQFAAAIETWSRHGWRSGMASTTP